MILRLPGVLAPLGAAALGALLLAAPACVVAVGAGAGYVVSREIDDDVRAIRVKKDVDAVWTAAREAIDILRDPATEPAFFADPRRIEARVDGRSVTVDVVVIDLDLTEVQIRAERSLVGKDRTAETIEQKILDRL
ncbi:MAG: hypothetical protein AB1726_04280 [Planctomycetota bacterium]